MKYCRLCLQPDTRPNSVFTDEGICPACNYSEQLKDVDWDDRYEELQTIVSSHRSSSKTRHDCIIGVSGGKDSTRQALWIRDNLGLNPLLVCLAYPPQQVSKEALIIFLILSTWDLMFLHYHLLHLLEKTSKNWV